MNAHVSQNAACNRFIHEDMKSPESYGSQFNMSKEAFDLCDRGRVALVRE